MGEHKPRTESSVGEPPVVQVAREVRAGRRQPAAFLRAFAEATVYCQRPRTPGVLVSDVPGRGRWVAVFSTLDRLGRFAGECDWQAMTGADLLDQLPSGVGVLLDGQDAHTMPLPATPDEGNPATE